MTISNSALSVFISSYALYNSEGGSAGKWYDISDYSCIDSLIEDVEADLEERGDSDPEIMCLDVQNDGLGLYAESGLDWVEKYITIFDSIDCDQLDAFYAYAKNLGGSPLDLVDSFADDFVGAYESEEAFGYEYFEDNYGSLYVEEVFKTYFDHEGFTRDLFMTDYFYADGYVFHNS